MKQDDETTLIVQSFGSGSCGNCVVVKAGETVVLVDFGFKTLKKCRQMLGEIVAAYGGIDAVLVTHAHIDHANEYSLRVLAENGITVRAEVTVLADMSRLYLSKPGRSAPSLLALDAESTQIGDIEVVHFPVRHRSNIRTYGFCLWAASKKVVIATDLRDTDDNLRKFANADVIFVEANHDPGMLKMNPNPNSKYHLTNAGTGRLLASAFKLSDTLPECVILGHLSRERNTPGLAMKTVKAAISKIATAESIDIRVAARDVPSRPVVIRSTTTASKVSNIVSVTDEHSNTEALTAVQEAS